MLDDFAEFLGMAAVMVGLAVVVLAMGAAFKFLMWAIEWSFS